MDRLKTWFVPGVACLIWLLQLLRNTVTPAASAILSFDGDVALHLLLGDLMRARGGLLDTEPTNYLMTDQPFIAHEWLAELVLSVSHDALGLAGPVLVAAVVLATLSASMFRRMVADGTGAWPAVLTLVVAFTVMNGHLHPRPHLVTWWFAFQSLCWLEDHRRGRLSDGAWLGRTAALLLLWAQMHGGFLVLFPIVGLYGAGALVRSVTAPSPLPDVARFRTLLVGGLVLLGVSALNPWGFALHQHFLAWLANPYMMSFTTEFQSPDFKSPGGRFLLAWLLLAWVALGAGRRRPAPEPFLVFLALSAMSLQSARHGALLAILTAPWVAGRLQDLIDDLAAGRGLARRVAAELDASSQRLVEAEARHGGWGTAAAVTALVAVAIGPLGTPRIGFDPSLQPVAAVDWIEAHPEAVQGRMFNPFRWGAYLAWRLYPEHRTFINSWHDHLGEQALRRYFHVHDVGPRWEELLDRYEVSWVVYETRSALATALDASPAWSRVYQDDTASIWVRESTE